MAVRNPALGKRGGKPETAILPRGRGGAASVTTNPRSVGQRDRLQHYLSVKNQQQYQARLTKMAQHYGVTTSGRITDAPTLLKLEHRASFAAGSVRQTLLKQIKQTQANGGSVPDLLAGRAQWKPDQVFVTEMNTADQMALRDFYDNHPELQTTGHVEPTDAEEDNCQEWIDAGSLPADQFPDFPLHVSCPHGIEPDEVPDTTELIPAGADMGDGSMLDQALTIATATADALRAVKWWLAGMTIDAAQGDEEED